MTLGGDFFDVCFQSSEEDNVLYLMEERKQLRNALVYLSREGIIHDLSALW
jgi:hypothetical protein